MKCDNCVWALYTGADKKFCPFPRGICMKPEPPLMKQVKWLERKQKKAPESPETVK